MQDVNDVAAAILDELGPMDTFKLEKLAYYSQAWHLAITDERLFPDDVLAFRNGPVVDELYRTHRGRYQVSAWRQGDKHQVSGTAQQVVRLVCNTYGRLSGEALSQLTHAEWPWLEARGDLPAHAASRNVISTQTMANFYRQRQIGNRTAADLASAGVFPMGSANLGEQPELAAQLEGVSAEYTSEPRHVPGGPILGRGQTESANLDVPGAAKIRSRKRP